jgi:hypothetical protein
MSTLEDLDDLEQEQRDKKQDQNDGDGKKPEGDGDCLMQDADKNDEEEEMLDEDILNSSTADIVTRRRMLENEMRIMKSEFQRLTHEQSTMREKVKDNQEKIENNRCAFTRPRIRCSASPRSLMADLRIGEKTLYPQQSTDISICDYLDNYHTLLETSSSYWILMWRQRQQRKGLI